jgi:hypothetical protein
LHDTGTDTDIDTSHVTLMASSNQLVAHLETRITPQHWQQLQHDGYTVIDQAFGNDGAQQLLDEMQSLDASELFRPNQVQFGQAPNVVVVSKPDIFELDLHQSPDLTRSIAPSIASLFDTDDLVHLMTRGVGASLGPFEFGTRGKTIKLQINRGGCFPWHYDNPGRPNRRRLTCLVYLNRDWSDGDGGEVVLQPFLHEHGAVVVRPLFDRVLMFRSDLLLHRVLQATRIRYCFTIWIDAVPDHVNTDADVSLRAKHLQLQTYGFSMATAAATLRATPLQRVLSRAVYAEEYERSLVECMRDSANTLLLVRSHQSSVDATYANQALAQFVASCRQYHREHCSCAPREI